jgi:RNA polymerase sigma factor (sigma-70 family)
MARWSPSDPHADRRLVEGLHEGNTTALATLYDTYAERLYDYCSSVVGEPAIAADIVHDVLIDASHRAPRMRSRTRLRPWLYGAARRRCLQRGRGAGLHWQGAGRPSDRPVRPPADETAADLAPADEAVPDEELRELLDAVLARLDFADQEALLFTLRHDLTGAELAALLGISNRRAAVRVSRARSRALIAVAAERQVFARRCGEAELRRTRAREVAEAAAELAGHTARRSLESDEAPATHITACPACRRRGQVGITALLDHLPAPTPPVALRHRVLHTANDSELAGYRADIAGRGGPLTPDGLPRQPDVPTPVTRRWAFLAGGTAGALATALVALLIIGPLLGRPDLYWSFRPRLEPSTSQPPGNTGPQEPPVAVGQKPPPPSSGPQVPSGRPSPHPPGVPAPSPGRLEIGSASIRFEARDRVAFLDLSASLGPVTWNAAVSTTRITISEMRGTIPAGSHTRLAVVLDRAQVEFPGEATITFMSDVDRRQDVTVTWAGSLLT